MISYVGSCWEDVLYLPGDIQQMFDQLMLKEYFHTSFLCIFIGMEVNSFFFKCFLNSESVPVFIGIISGLGVSLGVSLHHVIEIP